MKALISKLTVLFMIISVLIVTPTFGTKLNFTGVYSLYQNENLDSGRGLKLSADFNSPLYPWASYEETMLRFAGQEMSDMKVYGGGFGIKKDGWFAELGYYLPKYELRNSYKEALWLEINRVVSPGLDPAGYHGNGFTYEINDDFGLAVGKEFEYPLTDSLSLQFAAIYRWLRFKDVIICHFDSTTYWEVYAYRDFSGVLVNLAFQWRF